MRIITVSDFREILYKKKDKAQYTLKMKITIWPFLLLLGNFGCVNAQPSKEQQMKATFQKLVAYFQAKDTSSIRAMFEKENNPAPKMESADLLRDCKRFASIVEKYGLPALDSLKLTIGQSQENVVYVTLMQKEDGSLNLRRCDLGVLFYPDQFLTNPSKILTYQFRETPLSKPEKKLIIAPPLIPNNR